MFSPHMLGSVMKVLHECNEDYWGCLLKYVTGLQGGTFCLFPHGLPGSSNPPMTRGAVTVDNGDDDDEKGLLGKC